MTKLFHRQFIGKCLLSLLIPLLLGVVSAHADVKKKSITIGILANRPKEIAQPRWQPLADYLSDKLPGYEVKLLLGTNPEIEEAISRKRIDFIITNPAHYIQQRHRNRLSGAIASIVKDHNGTPVYSFGGVIFTKSSRKDIASIEDLKGKRIAAVAPSGAFGGYAAQAYELLKKGVKIREDCNFIFLGQPQDQTVLAVVDGRADAGFVRTGQLEQMIQEGTLRYRQLKIINRTMVPGFPYILSTALYPEWPFSALPHVDEDLARRVSSVLMKIEREHPALKRAQIQGFTIPPSYESVESMMRELRIPPYDYMPVFNHMDIWSRYKWLLMGLAAAGVIILMLNLKLGYSNRKLSMLQERLQKSIDRYDDLVNRVPCGVYTFRIRDDGSMSLDYVSPQFCRILGLDRDAIMKDVNNAFASVHPDDMAGFMKNLGDVIADRTVPYRWEGRGYVHGELRWIQLAADPSPSDGDGNLWSGVAIDITERKRAEELIRKLNANLEKVVEVRTGELAHINRELSSFCYAISHELRAPIARLQGFSAALMETSEDEESRQFMIERINLASSQLQNVIDSILMLSRLSRMQMEPEEIDFSTLAMEIVAELNSHGEGTKATISIQEGIICHADRNLLKLCLSNLIGNALKYTSRKEESRVRIGATTDGERICYQVSDNGAGFDPKYSHKLFVPFQRLHHQDEFPGTGIGLATVKRIIERHNGKVWAEGEVGRGATFFFTLWG
jgi:PAS domain S-box-containing protein